MNIYVGNLSWEVSDDDLRSFLASSAKLLLLLLSKISSVVDPGDSDLWKCRMELKHRLRSKV